MAERQIPGGPFINETGTREAQVPGGAFVNETVDAGGGVTRTPDAGAITITGQAPVITRFADPGVGAITITGLAPTIVIAGAGVTVTPDAGAIIIAGEAPTLAQTAHQFPSPGAGAIVIAGQVPTLAQTAHQSVTPDAGEITIAGLAPTIGVGLTVTPDVGAITLTGQAPTVAVTAHQTVNPGTGAIEVSGLAPFVIGGEGLAVTTVSTGAGSGRYRDEDDLLEYMENLRAMFHREIAEEKKEVRKELAKAQKKKGRVRASVPFVHEPLDDLRHELDTLLASNERLEKRWEKAQEIERAFQAHLAEEQAIITLLMEF